MLSIQCDMHKFDEEIEYLYNIVMSFGKYKYNLFPIRLNFAPDFAEQFIGELLLQNASVIRI